MGKIERSLAGYFIDAARRWPSRPALVVEGRCWLYDELAHLVSMIGRSLDAELPGSQSAVGVPNVKTASSYAAIIAIMQARHIYVPINLRLPPDTLRHVLGMSGVKAVVSDRQRANLPADLLGRCAGIRVIEAPEVTGGARENTAASGADLVESRDAKVEPRGERAPAEDIAYIMFTSGSTGRPKGVGITHANACACIDRAFDLFKPGEDDRFTQLFELSFDLSVSDIFLTWKSGACLYVPSPVDLRTPLDFVRRNKISVWGSVPSVANNMRKLGLLTPDSLPSLRLSWFCGEALSSNLAAAWAKAAPNSLVYNLYGPTEATIYFTFYRYQGGGAASDALVPIGRPMPGLCCKIVGDGSVIKAPGEKGELWLGGDQVAPGYWNNPTATQAAFVTDQDGRWYRTGDLASYDSDSQVLFHGRIDRQIKLNGYRVELLEIENAVSKATGSPLVAVVPVYGAESVCSHVIAFCDRYEGEEAAAKKACAAYLPDYLLPARVMKLPEFPHTENGKIDYGSLKRLAEAVAIW